MRRRTFLTASAMAMAGLAGCSGGSDGGDSTPTSTPANTATETSSSGGTSGALTGRVEEFYQTLYGSDNMEAANAMYHPESPAPPLKSENFEPFGGLSAIGANVQSTEVVATEEDTARVHATVDYSTPAGSATNTDYFTLRKHDGEWDLNMFLPASARGDMSEREIKGAMMANRTDA